MVKYYIHVLQYVKPVKEKFTKRDMKGIGSILLNIVKYYLGINRTLTITNQKSENIKRNGKLRIERTVNSKSRRITSSIKKKYSRGVGRGKK